MPVTSSSPLIKIPLPVMLLVPVCIPTISLIAVATLGVLLHFEETVDTHCKVPNFFPSLSAVVAEVTPERYIWRLGIAFMTTPRSLDSFIYYNLFSLTISNAFFKCLNILLFVLHWIQCLALYGLTYVSSIENYILHRNCFICFMFGSLSHILLFLYMFKRLRQPFSHKDKIAYRLRVVLAASHITAFAISLYFFWRHNTYCEPYMYSMYGLFEYLTIITNIAYYAVMFLDLSDSSLTMDLPSSLKKD